MDIDLPVNIVGDIVWLENGGFALAYRGPLGGQTLLRIFNEDGSARTEPLDLGAGPTASVSELIALPTGGLIAVIRDGIGTYGQVVNDDGSLTGGPFPTNIGRSPEMAILENLNHVVVATAPGADFSDDVFVRVMSSDSTIIQDRILVNTTTEGRQSEAQVAALTNGGFVVVYRSASQEILAQEFDQTGQKIGPEIVVAGGETGIGVVLPQVAALPDGGWVSTWQQSNGDLPNGANIDNDVYFRIFSENGVPITPPLQVDADGVNTTSLQPTVVSFPDGQFVIAWRDETYVRVTPPDGPAFTTDIPSIHYQLYDKTGAPNGDAVQFGFPYPIYDSVSSLSLQLAASESGNLLISWSYSSYQGDLSSPPQTFRETKIIEIDVAVGEGEPEALNPLINAELIVLDDGNLALASEASEEQMFVDVEGSGLDVDLVEFEVPGGFLTDSDTFVFNTSGFDICEYFGDGDDSTADQTFLLMATDASGDTIDTAVGVNLPSRDQVMANLNDIRQDLASDLEMLNGEELRYLRDIEQLELLEDMRLITTFLEPLINLKALAAANPFTGVFIDVFDLVSNSLSGEGPSLDEIGSIGDILVEVADRLKEGAPPSKILKTIPLLKGYDSLSEIKKGKDLQIELQNTQSDIENQINDLIIDISIFENKYPDGIGGEIIDIRTDIESVEMQIDHISSCIPDGDFFL